MATIRRRLTSLSLTFSPSSIEDPVRVALQRHVNHFSNLVTWSTIIVAIGVVLEGVEIFHDVIAWCKRKSRENRERANLKEVAEIFPSGEARGETESHADHPRWVKRVLRLGLIAVVVGVVGEWRYGAKLEDAHNAIHEYDVAELTAAEKEAGDAAASAKTAHDEADAIKKESDEIQKRLDIASAQLSGIEQAVSAQGPRWKLPETKKDEFINALKPFAGRKVFIMYCGRWGAIPIEPFRLAQDLMNFLGVNGGAGLQINGSTWDNCSAGGGSSAGGNLVLVSLAADKTVKALAVALDDTLNKLKISTIQTEADPREADPNAITTRFLGVGSPWVVAAKDPTSVVLLVGDNPMFDVSGWKQRHAKRQEPINP
jgi:hypothetical protein